MAPFDKFKPLGFDPFRVTDSAGSVIDEMKARDKAMIDNVESYTNAIAEMDKLRGGVEAILGNYEVDDSGKPSEAAPKYVHDAYGAVKKEGGLARMSKSQLSKVLQGYAVEADERKARNEERKLRNDEIDLQSQMRLRMQQGQLAEMQAREKAYELGEAERTRAMRDATARAELEGKIASTRKTEFELKEAQNVQDAGDFLDLANQVGDQFAVEREVENKSGTFEVDATTVLGFGPDGRPYFGSVNRRLTQAQLMEQVGDTGQTRGEIIRGLLETGGKNYLPNAEGIDPEEQQALADAMGIETDEVKAFKEDVSNTLKLIARNLRISETEIPALAAVLAEDDSNELYGFGVEIIWNRYKNDPTMGGPLNALIDIKNAQYNSPSSTTSPSYFAKDPTKLTNFLLKNAANVAIANGQEAGVDETQTANRIAAFGPVLKDYRLVRNGIAITRAEAVVDSKRERVLDNLRDSEEISKAQYNAAVAIWRAQNPGVRVPLSYSAFALQTMSNVTRTITERNPDGSIKSERVFYNTGGPNSPKWELGTTLSGQGQTASERQKEMESQAVINAMYYGEIGNPKDPPRVYGDIELSGTITRNAAGSKGIADFEESAQNYGQFINSVDAIADLWDDMNVTDILPTDSNKVLTALVSIAQMSNKDILVGPGVVTALDYEALQEAMKSPKLFSSWINKGANRKALRALASKMKESLTQKAKSLGLQYRETTPSAVVQKAQQDADTEAEKAKMNKTR